MPQLDPSSFISQIFWLTITFLSLWFLVSFFILPRIKEIIEIREKKIENDIQKAESINKQALQTFERYEKALNKAKTEADNKITDEKLKLENKLEQKKAEINRILEEKIAQNEKILKAERINTLNAVDEISFKTATLILQKLDLPANIKRIKD